MKRVSRSKEEAKNFYNKISNMYDLLIDWWEKKYRQVGLEKLNIKEREKILEIGCGTGDSLLTIAEQVGDGGLAHGIDISDKMISQTRRKIKEADLEDRVKLDCCDALQFSPSPNTYDAIFISFTLELFDTPEIPKLLFLCKQWLKPGGRICIVSLVREPKLMVKVYEWLHEKFPVYFDCRPICLNRLLEEVDLEIQVEVKMSMYGLPVKVIAARNI